MTLNKECILQKLQTKAICLKYSKLISIIMKYFSKWGSNCHIHISTFVSHLLGMLYLLIHEKAFYNKCI